MGRLWGELASSRGWISGSVSTFSRDLLHVLWEADGLVIPIF